jgi:hypothetical protein
MSWVWAIGAVWLLLGGLVGVLIGRGIRIADRRQAESTAIDSAAPNFVVDHASVPDPTRSIPGQAPVPAAERIAPQRRSRGA